MMKINDLKSYTNQRGSTLIVVLVIVILIMIIGAVVIKQGLVSLNLATNSQAQNLMVQNSDAAVFNVEDTKKLSQAMTATGMFGYINSSGNKGKELVFCYRGSQNQFFLLSQASVIKWLDGSSAPNNSELGLSGYCKVGNSKDYTSSRDAVMTQVSIQIPNQVSNSTTPFGGSTIGTDTKSSKTLAPTQVIVHAVSLVPTLATDAKVADINACLSNYMSNPPVDKVNANPKAGLTISQCLTELHVPFVTHVSEYKLSQDLKGS